MKPTQNPVVQFFCITMSQLVTGVSHNVLFIVWRPKNKKPRRPEHKKNTRSLEFLLLIIFDQVLLKRLVHGRMWSLYIRHSLPAHFSFAGSTKISLPSTICTTQETGITYRSKQKKKKIHNWAWIYCQIHLYDRFFSLVGTVTISRKRDN